MASKPFLVPQPAPDAAQRRLALDPERSFWVQAPAGSGKTELLIQRYLTLLARVAEPESVVAITFTIKAAGEMRDRVLRALARAEGPEPEEPHERETWLLASAVLQHDARQEWNLRQSPARMRIETFDALCLSLAKRLPVVARLGGQPEIEDSPEYLYTRAAHRTVCLIEDDAEAGAAVRTLLHHLGNDLDELSRWFAGLLPRRDQWRSFAGIGNPQSARTLLEENRAAIAGLSPHYNDREWSMVEALLVLLPRAWGFLWEEFEQAGRVDFSEVAMAALRALGPRDNPTDLGLAIGHRIEHLLVDEMQDTSRTQIEIIQSLTAGWEAVDPHGPPKTLFLVGDPMQSIYRFREADVGNALGLASGEVELPVQLETIRLTANFRSVPDVVDWVNDAFSRVFATADDARRGAVRYAPAVSTRRDAGDVAVEVHPFVGTDRTGPARRAVELAEAAVERGERTAILVRARTHLPEILAELAKRPQLKYHALDIDTLTERPAIGDLLALTRALLHPADRIAWLAVLRAPWCGLTLADLHALANTQLTIAQRLGNAVEGISTDGQARLRRVAPVLLQSLDRARTIPLRALVEDAWLALGGAASLASPGDEADSRVYLDLLAALDSGGAVASFAELEARTAKLFARPDPSVAEPLLEVMTIHNAKGLEFETVIVPGLDRITKGDDARLLEWTWDGGRFLVAPRSSDWDGGTKSEILDHIKNLEKERENEEVKRLLYVAATRARRHLHWIATVDVKADGTFKKVASNTLLSHLWPMFEQRFEAARLAREQEATLPSDDQLGFSFEPPQMMRRVPVDFAGGALPALPGESPIDVTYEWVGETLRLVGKTVHAWLHRLATTDAAMPSAATIREALRHAGVAHAELDFATGRVEDALRGTLAHDKGQWLLRRREWDRREYAITGVVDGQPVRGVVDCTFVEDGIRWIIDFKTSYHEGAGREEFLINEQRRYEGQLARYARLLKSLGPEPIRLGLYFPLLGGWREWQPAI